MYKCVCCREGESLKIETRESSFKTSVKKIKTSGAIGRYFPVPLIPMNNDSCERSLKDSSPIKNKDNSIELMRDIFGLTRRGPGS